MSAVLLRDPDYELEQRIEQAKLVYIRTQTPESLRRFEALVKQRSPEQVARMERALVLS